MSVFRQLGQEKQSIDLMVGSVADRLTGARFAFISVSPGCGRRMTEPGMRRIYALGCWLAIEHLQSRMEMGNQVLQRMEEQGQKNTPRYDRLSVAWLKLGFRAVALIGRMAVADPEIEAQFTASPTGRYFADEEWPQPPIGFDADYLLVKAAQLALAVG
jgi:hypothetical protein